MTFGGLSTAVKRVVDRSIPYVHPFFELRAGPDGTRELHHRRRYPNVIAQEWWLWGPSTEAERACAERLWRANAAGQNGRAGGLWFPSSPAGVGAHASAPATARTEPPAWTTPPGRPAWPLRVTLVNGSPRGARSNTHALLAGLAAQLADTCACDSEDGACCHMREPGSANLLACDTIVLGFPLYVDALPSGVIGLLERLAKAAREAPGLLPCLYAVANCGFYEAAQIRPAFAVLENFCAASDLAWCGGVAVGGGELVGTFAGMPRDARMRRPVSQAIDTLARAIEAGTPAGVMEVEQAIPRILYRPGGEARWRREARANGLRPRDLGRRVGA